jgi:hypothetical protein
VVVRRRMSVSLCKERDESPPFFEETGTGSDASGHSFGHRAEVYQCSATLTRTPRTGPPNRAAGHPLRDPKSERLYEVSPACRGAGPN